MSLSAVAAQASSPRRACVSAEEGGRIGGRGGGPLTPGSAHESDAQIVNAPLELNVVATAARNIRLHFIAMPLIERHTRSGFDSWPTSVSQKSAIPTFPRLGLSAAAFWSPPPAYRAR